MFDYIKKILKIIDKIDPKVTVTKSSITPTELFSVRDVCTKLETKKSEQFHKVVVKICFDTKRSRTDTGTAISYMITRVIEPDEYDWYKLKHLIN